MDQLTKTLKKFAHRCATETVKRVPAAPERVVQRNTNTRIDTTTLTSQLPSGTVMKTQPRSEPKKWKPTGDYFPWVVGALWTLIVTGASGFSAFPAVIIGCIEIAFFVYNKLLAQNANTPALPERMSRDLMELWDNCLKYSPDGAADFLSGWFYAPLSRAPGGTGTAPMHAFFHRAHGVQTQADVLLLGVQLLLGPRGQGRNALSGLLAAPQQGP
jgi:hypothetical protein